MSIGLVATKEHERTHLQWADVALRHIVDAYHPQYVFLYGSVARGDWDNASDIDFMIVDGSYDGRPKALSAPQDLKDKDCPDIHIWAMGAHTFAVGCHVPGSFAYMIGLEGKEVYKKNGTGSMEQLRKGVTMAEID